MKYYEIIKMFSASEVLRTGDDLVKSLVLARNTSQAKLQEERIHLLQVLNKRAEQLDLKEDKKHREQESLAELMRQRFLSSLW